jgi:hypothetical protein
LTTARDIEQSGEVVNSRLLLLMKNRFDAGHCKTRTDGQMEARSNSGVVTVHCSRSNVRLLEESTGWSFSWRIRRG